MNVTLFSPHSVLAVLETRPRDIVQLQIPSGNLSEAWQMVEGTALDLIQQRELEHSMLVRRPPPQRKSAKGGRAGTAGSAEVRAHRGESLDALFDGADAGGLWLAMDCLQDPHNVGAIFRAAAFFGVRGIVMTRDRSAPITGVAYDVASGGIEHVPFAIESNLVRVIKVARDKGLWVLGTSEHAERPLSDVPRDRAWLVVVGNEESGLRRLTIENCDELCTIPGQGAVDSLNVSVAAGILMHALSGE